MRDADGGAYSAGFTPNATFDRGASPADDSRIALSITANISIEYLDYIEN